MTNWSSNYLISNIKKKQFSKIESQNQIHTEIKITKELKVVTFIQSKNTTATYINVQQQYNKLKPNIVIETISNNVEVVAAFAVVSANIDDAA